MLSSRAATASILVVLSLLLACDVHTTKSSCIVEGTLIATPEGDRRIDSVRVGSRVWTKSPNAEREIGIVARIWEHNADQHLVVQMTNGRELLVTDNHPVATPFGWIEAGSLGPGSKLMTDSGECSVARIHRKSDLVRVYDLSVEPNQNYFASGVLVHNKSMKKAANRSELDGNWVGISPDMSVMLRLEIAPDGTGSAAYYNDWPQSSTPDPIKVVSAAVDGYKITIIMHKPIPAAYNPTGEPGIEEITLVGNGYSKLSLWESQEYRDGKPFGQKMTLFRPHVLRERLDRTGRFVREAIPPDASPAMPASGSQPGLK